MAELVRHTCDERGLRAHHDEVDVERPGQREQPFGVLAVHRMATAERGDAGISGSCMKVVEARRLAQLPGERVLASA